MAGASKLADRESSRQTMIDFGVVVALAAPLGLLLPLSELAVAAALVPAVTVWWGSVGALTLLMLFVAGISINLARGHKPECHCFGQFHSAPAGWRTLARNGVLAAIAAFVVWKGRDGAGPSAVSWLGDLIATQLVALVLGLVVFGLLLAQWWVLLHLLRQNGRLLTRIEALEGSFEAGGAAPLPNDVPLQVPEALQLVDSKTFSTGVLYLTYQPVQS